MKRGTSFTILLGLLVWLPSACGVALAQSTPERGDLVVKSPTARVMSGQKLVAEVQGGQRLRYTGQSGSWYLVEIPQGGTVRKGFIHAKDVLVEEAAPTVETAPTVDSGQEPTIPGWGTFFDPVGDATAVKKNGAVELRVPGVFRDLWPGGAVNAPRILRTVKGDFSVQVKVTSPVDVAGLSLTAERPEGASSIFRAAVLIVWHDENNFVRLERGSSHTTPRFWFHKKYLDGKIAMIEHGIVRPDAASWLRIQRKQGTLYAWYRQDGDKEWTAMKVHTLGLPDEVQVGVSLINTTSESFSVRFEDFVVE